MTPERWYKAYFFDIDGTLALGDAVIPGTLECIRVLREKKKIVRFLSNESTTDNPGHVRRLRKLGIECDGEEILTTIEATSAWIADNYPQAKVFPIGAPDLKQNLDSNAISVTEDPAEMDIVIASCDRHLSYPQLAKAFTAFYQYKQPILIATNPDRLGPTGPGTALPDTGMVIAAIEESANVKCQVVIGKPNPTMLLAELAKLGIAPEDALMIGDTFETDIQVAHNAGTASAVTLTGDTSLPEVTAAGPDIRPTWVVENLTEIIPEEDRPQISSSSVSGPTTGA